MIKLDIIIVCSDEGFLIARKTLLIAPSSDKTVVIIRSYAAQDMSCYSMNGTVTESFKLSLPNMH